MGKGYNARIASNPYIVGSFACIGGGLFGLDISSMSGVLDNDHYKSTFGFPNSAQQGAITAAMPAGSLIGALLVTWLADRLGRKKTIMLGGAFWVVGAILQCASVDRAMLVVGRIVAGLSVGISSAVVPIYQAEVTEPSIRGRMISLQQWSITWGILIQFYIQFGTSSLNSNASFRIPWGLQMIPAIVLILGMMFFPESPRWLIDNGHEEQALEILADLHGGGDTSNPLVQFEFQEIKEQVAYERQEGAKSYLDLLRPSVARRVMLGTSLQMWSQLTGMNVMMYYVVYVFQGAGITGPKANLQAASIQYALNVALTVPAIIYIDRWGRRPMLLVGLAFMAFWLFLIGGLSGAHGRWENINGPDQPAVWIVQGSKALTNTIITCTYLFVCSFAITMGPVSWTYPAEIFPLKVRAKAVSLSTASNWLFNTALAFAVPPGLSTIAWKTYFIFATFNAAAFIHVLFMFPETVGRTLEEMEEVFAEGHVFTAWRVGKGVGKRNVEDVTGAKTKQVEGKEDSKEDVAEEKA